MESSYKQFRGVSDVSILQTMLRLNDIALPYKSSQELHMGSHSVACHVTQVNTPRLNPSQLAGTRFIYRGGMEGWVDLDQSDWLHSMMVYSPTKSDALTTMLPTANPPVLLINVHVAIFKFFLFCVLVLVWCWMIRLCGTVGWWVGPEPGTWLPAVCLQPDRSSKYRLWSRRWSVFLQAWRSWSFL